MRRFGLTLAVVMATAPLGCRHDHGHDDEHGHAHEDEHGDDEHGDDEHGHAHGDDEHGDDEHGDGHDDGHGHGHEGASEVVTRWGEATQLFVEFPALVVGEDSRFAAHLTRLSDHFAIDRGRVVVELTGGGQPVERFTVDGPSPPGIFRPVVRPAHPGRRVVTLRLDSPAASAIHAVGTFTVFPTRAAADEAADEDDEPDDAISYLLEQQWKVPFKVAPIEARPMRPSIAAFARLTPPSDADAIIRAPADGRLRAAGPRFVSVGDAVASGAPLFELSVAPPGGADPAALDLAVEQAGIQLAAARRDVDRLAPLVEQGAVPRRRLDEARAAVAAAAAEQRSARRRKLSLGQSQRVEGESDALTLPSPIAGAITELHVTPGAWVIEGQPLARVVDRDRLWLDVGVPESEVATLRRVSGAWFSVPNGRGVFELPAEALVSVGAMVDAQSRTLPVRLRVDNGRGELFAGMSVQAHLIVDAPRVNVAVPKSAVVHDNGQDVVFVQLGGETFARRVVRLGLRDGEMIEVQDGVLAGEWVVAEGAWSVKLAASSTAAIGHGHAH